MKKSVKAFGIVVLMLASLFVMTQAVSAQSPSAFYPPYSNPNTNVIENQEVVNGVNHIYQLSAGPYGYVTTNIQSSTDVAGLSELLVRGGYVAFGQFTVAQQEYVNVTFYYTIVGDAGFSIIGVPGYWAGYLKLIYNFTGMVQDQYGGDFGPSVWTVINAQWAEIGGWTWTYNGMNRQTSVIMDAYPGITYTLYSWVYAETLVSVAGAGTGTTVINITSNLDKVTIAPDPSNSTSIFSGVVGSSQILMDNGLYENAQQINKGDILTTYNQNSGQLEIGRVINVYQSTQLEEVTLNQNISLSPYQEVLTERGWVQAVNVTLNDSLYNAQSNSYIPVTSNIELTGNYVMYNYQISGESQSCIVGGYAIQFQTYQPNG